MKKYMIFCLFAGFFLIQSQAGAQEIKIGIKGGANFASIESDLPEADDIISYHGGLFSRFSLADAIGLQVEALYSQQGADGIDLTYIQVPALFRLNLFTDKLGLYLGPQFSYLLEAEADYVERYPTLDESDIYKDLEFSAVGGLEVDVVGGLIIGGRYIYSLDNIDEEVTIDPSLSPGGISISPNFGGQKNEVFQLYLGYAF